MKKTKKILYSLLFPPTPVTILSVIISASALAAIFIQKKENSIAAYPVYVLSFYSLCVLCAYIAVKMPKQIKSAKLKISKTEYGKRYMTDAVFRTRVSLYISLSVNLLYSTANLITGYNQSSVWFYILAVYYAILSVMRFILLRYSGKKNLGKNIAKEYRQCRICAFILLSVNLSLSATVLMMIYENRGFEYKGIFIYAMAAYTFYITVHTAINLIKYRNFKSPVMTTVKAVSFTSAMISMLSLETAMLSSFGSDMTIQTKQYLIVATGAAISIILVTMSVLMIKKASKGLKKELNNEKQ